MKSAEREREQLLIAMEKEVETREGIAQRKREEAEQQKKLDQQNAERIKHGRVFSKISKDLQGYTLEQISANPELQDHLLSVLPGLLDQNAQRIASLKEMLDSN